MRWHAILKFHSRKKTEQPFRIICTCTNFKNSPFCPLLWILWYTSSARKYYINLRRLCLSLMFFYRTVGRRFTQSPILFSCLLIHLFVSLSVRLLDSIFVCVSVSVCSVRLRLPSRARRRLRHRWGRELQPVSYTHLTLPTILRV